MTKFRIVAISDTHMETPDLPKGDLLIHTGDWTYMGKLAKKTVYTSDILYLPKDEVGPNQKWIDSQKHKFRKIVCTSGNHDWGFDKDTFQGVIMLFDEEITIEGLKIYGTPYVPRYGDWAFMESEERLAERYDKIPEGLDILISHGPPYGILDANKRGDRCGSKALLNKLKSMKSPPRYMFFGHIHRDSNSPHNPVFDGKTYFYNVSYNNESYSPTNDIVEVDIEVLK